MYSVIVMTIIGWGYSVYKYTLLYAENQKLREENEALVNELHDLKFTPIVIHK